MINKLVENQQIVQALWNAVNTSSGGLETVAPLVKKLLTTDAWKKREIPQLGCVVEFDSFPEFITAPPLKGCGWPLNKVEALIKDEPETLAMWREAVTDHPGGDQKSEEAKINNNNVMIDRKAVQGNSKSYALDRLKRTRPDLFEKVCAKEMSTNAAAIEAGFRKKPKQQKWVCPKCGCDAVRKSEAI